MGWLKENLKTVIIVVVVGGIVAFYGGIKVADMPFFCGMLCHEMKPHVASLKANVHGGKNVICMDCHSHQGFFNHATEHIKSLALLGGHFSKAYLEDEFDLHKNVQGFNKEEMDFKHKSKEEQDKIAKECLKCHPARMTGSYFMVQPEFKDKMMNENCHRCHEEIVKTGEKDIEKAKGLLSAETEKPAIIGNVHPIHIGKDILCTSCHNRVVHSVNPSVMKFGMDNCMKCHNGEKAPKVECKGCHNGPKNLFAGTGARDVKGSADFMAEQECTGCHNETEAFKYSDELCTGCHDEGYAKTRQEWQSAYENNMAKASEGYKALKETFEKAKAENKVTAEIEEKFKKLEYNYAFVSIDRSRGVHNSEYSKSIFSDIDTKVNEIKEVLK
ncbi:MAG: hypothetical protein PHX78_07765 [bacterium]|nr:hypothetical protein [bacterium]